MKIKFLKTYNGRETAMQTYQKGRVADIPTAQALELMGLGVAVEAKESEEKKPKAVDDVTNAP